jgi:hypothetical protein
MPDPLKTVYVFRGFVEADRAKSFLESKGISALVVEKDSETLLNPLDVVHLRVAESDALRAFDLLVAEGHLAPPGGSDPDIDPPAEGETTYRCPLCGRAFSAEYDFCPYCEPPAAWLETVLPKRRAILAQRTGDKQETRKEPTLSERDQIARWAFYSALLGLCVCPLGMSLISLYFVVRVAFHHGEMSEESRVNVKIALILALTELGLVTFVLASLTIRSLAG